jgi:hypothetical protein
MPNIAGAFTAHVTAQSAFTAADQPNHQLQLVEIHATQNSADPDWNNSRVTYCGISDLLSGNGTQHGYYGNQHPNGDRDYGSFEAKVTTSGGQTTLEGRFTITGGTGKYQGIRGSGTYKGRQVSLTDIEITWTGAYELAEAAGRVA